jgi:signal transduction histidine kinase/CheY-like chemotaxis protein
MMTGFIQVGNGSKYYLLSLIGPTIRLISAFVYCRTDSERGAGYTSIALVYTLLYLGLPKNICFELFMMQGSAFTMLSGIVMGSEGALVTMVSNLTLGALFYSQQQNFDTSGRDLTLLWAPFVMRTITEAVLTLIGIRKFTETFARFEEADKHKTEFLCRMSHELRTPLSGIIGAIDILKFAPLTDEYVKLINIAKTCSANLLQLINDILDFSKIEAGKMKLMVEPIKMRELIDEVSAVVSPLLSQKRSIEFKSTVSKKEVPAYFVADKTKVKQILVNFLSNAVKFTSQGSITLSVKLTTFEDVKRISSAEHTMTSDWTTNRWKKFLRFSVKDTGIGVSQPDFKRLFSAFEQLANRKEDEVVGGTGLGLNICLLLVKLMQGAIRIKSKGVHKGSKFLFWIPYEEELSPQAEESPRDNDDKLIEPLSKTPLHVYLVEDNAVNQVVIKGQLTRLGCEVDQASNGLIAVQRMKLTPPPHYDIILLDLEMPIKDGITTVTELRSMGVTTPIIALTAHAVEEKRTMALKAGMDDFLMKPCSIDTLKQCLDKYRHKFCK